MFGGDILWLLCCKTGQPTYSAVIDGMPWTTRPPCTVTLSGDRFVPPRVTAGTPLTGTKLCRGRPDGRPADTCQVRRQYLEYLALPLAQPSDKAEVISARKKLPKFSAILSDPPYIP